MTKDKLEQFERIEVGLINTPLELMHNLSKKLNKGQLYIKRDDLTGLALGGNKSRKLDYLVKYAIDHGYTTLLTFGGPQTNHGRMTIAAAAKYNMKSILVCDGKPPEKMTGNLVLDRMMDAKLVFIDSSHIPLDIKDRDQLVQSYKDECVQQVIMQYHKMGEKVFIVPMGGSNVLGAIGYMASVKEIIEQMETQAITADFLVTGFGSIGTFAGLWLGAKYYNAPFEIIGIPVFPRPLPFDEQQCAQMINELAALLKIDIHCKASDIRIEDGPVEQPYYGLGYSVPDATTRKYIYLLAKTEGIILDPCYTGKSFRGFYDLKASEVLPKASNAIFLHTGGAPALWAKNHLDAMQSELWKQEDMIIFKK